jgi:hypothetical protein
MTRHSYKALIQLFRPAGLPTQALNDKGRYRQQRAMAISNVQPLLQNGFVRASRSEFHPFQAPELGC